MKIWPLNAVYPEDFRIEHRRILVATLVLLLTGPAALLMADLHWRTGFNGWKVFHLLIFVILFGMVSFGAVQSFIGFLVRRRGGDPQQILEGPVGGQPGDATDTRIAIVMPICNEEVTRVIEGLRVIYESVAETGHLAEFEFFLLSDSTIANHWIEEEAAWIALTQMLAAKGKIFYRKRRMGTSKKAGNIADFCRRWGRRYQYMVVLDADSIMTGSAIMRLVRTMDVNAHVGIVQGAPLLVNGETLFARMQQFASRLYGPIFAAGFNFWQLGEANYWGHNAIIRVAPFIENCSLPELPGDGPFGGRIMSHDYVEAALMRGAGWEVWLLSDLEGSFEEGPANLVDYANRDRRWLQGNLQHARLLTARGLNPVSRLHFSLGILSYLASPLWLALLLTSTIIALNDSGAAPGPSFGQHLPWSFAAQAMFLFLFTLVLLFVPKILALLDIRKRPAEVKAFGGWENLVGGVLSETFVSTLTAPILMFFHTKFIVLTLSRRSIAWLAQRRGRAGVSAWGEAVRAHMGQTLVGLVWCVITFNLSPSLALWMSPIFAGLMLSIPVSYLTGSLEIGLHLQKIGLFRTPEESSPTPELRRLAERLSAQAPDKALSPELASDYGLMQAVLDPYVNAVHVALLRVKDDLPPASEERFAGLRETLLREGPAEMSNRDKISLLMDVDSMNALHAQVWSLPSSRLSPWWRSALDHYNVIAPSPQTALTR